jgi:hypothetical protein
MKLEAKDLRIGNWLQNNFGTSYQVTPSLILEFSLFGIKDKPIPLTEEWLLRFGFKHIIEKSGFKALKKELNSINQDWEMFYELKNDKYSFYLINDANEVFYLNHIEQVHSLQNLYHSLTGEELHLN